MRAKHCLRPLPCHISHPVTKFAQGNLMRPRPRRPEVSNPQRLLQRQRGGHDLAKDGANGALRQAALLPRVQGDKLAQQLFLPLRA